MKAALIGDNGLVLETVEVVEGFTLSDMFHPEAGFIEAPDDVQVGMLYKDGNFGEAPEPEIPLDELKAIRYREVNKKLNEVLTRGFVFNGNTYQIDTVSQQRITSAGLVAQLSQDFPSDFFWVTEDNKHIPMSADEMKSFACAALLYASRCQSNAADLKDQIAVTDNADAIKDIDIEEGYPEAEG